MPRILGKLQFNASVFATGNYQKQALPVIYDDQNLRSNENDNNLHGLAQEILWHLANK